MCMYTYECIHLYVYLRELFLCGVTTVSDGDDFLGTLMTGMCPHLSCEK